MGPLVNLDCFQLALPFTDDAFIKLVPPPIEGHDGIFRGKKKIRVW